MTRFQRALLATTLVAAPVAVADADPLLRPGAYEVEVRLELPNVLSWSPQRIATICLPTAKGAAPFPVLSANNPLADCAVNDIRHEGARLAFNLACSGRGSAVAWASYSLQPEAFRGRIAMVMGGKNMTMTEVQTGRRIGDCVAPSMPVEASVEGLPE
jgi:Protein of unknown function (DUF3617)